MNDVLVDYVAGTDRARAEEVDAAGNQSVRRVDARGLVNHTASVQNVIAIALVLVGCGSASDATATGGSGADGTFRPAVTVMQTYGAMP